MDGIAHFSPRWLRVSVLSGVDPVPRGYREYCSNINNQTLHTPSLCAHLILPGLSTIASVVFRNFLDIGLYTTLHLQEDIVTMLAVTSTAGRTATRGLVGLYCRRSLTAAASPKYDYVLVDKRERVGIVQFNRPKVSRGS